MNRQSEIISHTENDRADQVQTFHEPHAEEADNIKIISSALRFHFGIIDDTAGQCLATALWRWKAIEAPHIWGRKDIQNCIKVLKTNLECQEARL